MDQRIILERIAIQFNNSSLTELTVIADSGHGRRIDFHRNEEWLETEGNVFSMEGRALQARLVETRNSVVLGESAKSGREGGEGSRPQ